MCGYVITVEQVIFKENCINIDFLSSHRPPLQFHSINFLTLNESTILQESLSHFAILFIKTNGFTLSSYLPQLNIDVLTFCPNFVFSTSD